MEEFVQKQTRNQILGLQSELSNEGPTLASCHLFYRAASEEVADVAPTMPHWLLPFLHRVFRFLELRTVAAECLVSPAAWHPFLLDVATTLPQAELLSDLFVALKELGSAVLAAILSLSIYTHRGEADSGQLKLELDAACQTDTLAGVMRKLPISKMILGSAPDLKQWQPPGVLSAVRESGTLSSSGDGDVSDDDFANVFRAVIAAHFLQQPSGFIAATQFWNRTSGQNKPLLEEFIMSHHIGGCEQFYYGRTPTIATFQEIEGQDSQNILRVCYEWRVENEDSRDGLGYVEYTRIGDCLLERAEGGEWFVITYSYRRGVFLSPNMMNNRSEPRPLPNKIYKWLFLKPLLDLLKPKPDWHMEVV